MSCFLWNRIMRSTDKHTTSPADLAANSNIGQPKPKMEILTYKTPGIKYSLGYHTQPSSSDFECLDVERDSAMRPAASTVESKRQTLQLCNVQFHHKYAEHVIVVDVETSSGGEILMNFKYRQLYWLLQGMLQQCIAHIYLHKHGSSDLARVNTHVRLCLCPTRSHSRYQN